MYRHHLFLGAAIICCGSNVYALSFDASVGNVDVVVSNDLSFNGVTNDGPTLSFDKSIGTVDVIVSNDLSYSPTLQGDSDDLPYPLGVSNQPIVIDPYSTDYAPEVQLVFSTTYTGDGSSDSSKNRSHTDLISPFPSTKLSFSSNSIPQITYPSMTTPVSGALNVLIAGANATITAIMTAKNTSTAMANAAVNVGYEIVRPHHEAIKAGVNAERRLMEAQPSAGTQAFERARDTAIYNYYVSNGFPADRATVPTGPMQRLTRGVISFSPMFTSTQYPSDWIQWRIAAIDEAYRSGAVEVYLPGEINAYNAASIVGQEAFQRLDRLQRMALYNSVLIIGDVNRHQGIIPATQAAGVSEYNWDGTAPAGTFYLNTPLNPGPTDMETAVVHETVHSADALVMTLAKQVLLSNSNIDAELRGAAVKALRAAETSYFGAYYDSLPDVLDVRDSAAGCGPDDAAECARKAAYIKYITEFRAYSVDAENQALILGHLEDTGLTPAEAQAVYTGVIESNLITEIEADMNRFIDLFQTR